MTEGSNHPETLWLNNYAPSREGIDITLELRSKAIASYLGGDRKDWDVFSFQVDDEGIAVLFDAAVLKVLDKPTRFFSNREYAVLEKISDARFLGSEFHKKLEFYRTGQRLKSLEITRGSSAGSLLAANYGEFKAVFTGVSFNSSPGTDSTDFWHIAVIRKDESEKMRDYLFSIYNLPKKSYRIYTYDANSSGAATTSTATGLYQSWDNLVLNDEVLNLVKKDSESFITRRGWFKKNNLPFRRGYLFHGPPGNGKTSTIKTLLSSLGMNAYKIRLFSKNISDQILETMFTHAQQQGPSIVVLEDLDRAFPKTGERDSSIGVHTLLNCLDGLTSQEGVITIATANEPTILDKAILKRPGRFDRVVFFDNPDHATRIRYLLKKTPNVSREELQPAADASEGFSFAQMQEVYILGGQRAYERGTEEITGEDLAEGAKTLRDATGSVNMESKRKGF